MFACRVARGEEACPFGRADVQEIVLESGRLPERGARLRVLPDALARGPWNVPQPELQRGRRPFIFSNSRSSSASRTRGFAAISQP
jgi:hypothetical protein